MKAKNVQSIICLVIFFLFANQVWAVDWIYYDKAAVGDFYYDKSSIKKVNESITSVSTKNILSEEAKMKYFSALKVMHKAPKNPSMLSYYTKLMQIDCVHRKIKDISVIFYNEKDKVVYKSPKSESGEWNDILPDTVGDKLINIVSCEPVTPKEVVVAPKIEEPVTPKEAPPAQKISKKEENNPSVEITKPNIPSSSNLGTQSNSASLTEKSQKLRELKKLKDEGLLTDKEYEQKRKSIVEGM
jgi:hypothetical protein